MGVLSQLRVAAAAHPGPAAPRLVRPSETGQAVAAPALRWPWLPVRHG